MPNNHPTGTKGEKDVIRLVPCPNCGKLLMQLPRNYPMYDLQCTSCLFRAQVKTNNSRQKKEILGATWDIVDKVLKAGFVIPPLIANFVWEENGHKRRKVIFYPFIPKTHLRMRSTEIKKSGRKLKMFNYVRLDELPQIILYEK